MCSRVYLARQRMQRQLSLHMIVYSYSDSHYCDRVVAVMTVVVFFSSLNRQMSPLDLRLLPFVSPRKAFDGIFSESIS